MIKTLINADLEAFEEDMRQVWQDQEFNFNHRFVHSLLVTRYNDMKHFLTFQLICRWRGHNLVDNGSYATPDSGAESLICTRCGFVWHHIYY